MIRAVLGRRVREILETHFANGQFFAPDTAFAEAGEHLPEIFRRRGLDRAAAVSVLEELSVLIDRVEAEIYSPFETTARRRLRKRDEDDWPVLAVALALECAIWTEDADFFGALSSCSTSRIPRKWAPNRMRLFGALEAVQS